MWRCKRFLRSFYGDLIGKMMVEMVVWSGTWGESEGVWEKGVRVLCLRENEKEKVERTLCWPAKRVRGWDDMCGSSEWIGEARGIWLKLTLHVFLIKGLGCYILPPLIKISSSKFYVPWSWKRFGYLDNILSSHCQDASFTEWFF